jgi:hypothetical protein
MTLAVELPRDDEVGSNEEDNTEHTPEAPQDRATCILEEEEAVQPPYWLVADSRDNNRDSEDNVHRDTAQEQRLHMVQ